MTVVERYGFPGGRVGQADIRGYRIDTGATVLTMPDIIEEAFDAVGASMGDSPGPAEARPGLPGLLRRRQHAGRAHRRRCDDGGHRGVRRAGPGRGYLRLREWLTELYKLEIEVHRIELLLAAVARDTAVGASAAMGGFRGWEKMVSRFISDERVQRIFTFQALYAGVPPQHALAAYAVIAYMDTVAGCIFRGGMRAVPEALAAAAVRCRRAVPL